MGWKFKLAAVVMGLAATAGQLAAQDAYLAQIYGDGVHLYFRRDVETAKCRFDAAVNHGSRDPRVYYFRAIIAIEQGDSGSALNDVRQGARYELEGRGTYDIWRALDRVQGPHRLQFECLRREALLDLRKQSVTDRYPLDPDTDYLRPPADPMQTPLEPDVPSMPDGDPNDPFADEPPEAPFTDDMDDDGAADDFMEDDDLGLDDDQPMTDESAAEVDDPFGEDEMGTGEAAADDPFADDAGMEDAAADDPFADDAAADDTPMEPAADGAAPAESGDDPFADDASSDDPFGEDLGDADDTPPDVEDDPFGENAPDSDDDPFGEIFE